MKIIQVEQFKTYKEANIFLSKLKWEMITEINLLDSGWYEIRYFKDVENE